MNHAHDAIRGYRFELLNFGGGPHGAPLGDVERLDDPRHLVHKGDGSRGMEEHVHVADLFPGHGHVLQQLVHCMRGELEGTQVDTLVVSKLSRCHVTVVLHDLAHDLFGEVLFLRGCGSSLLFGGPLALAECGPLLGLQPRKT